MARGFYLSLGLNSVDPLAYLDEFFASLRGAEDDARTMAELLEQAHFEGGLLLGTEVSRQNMVMRIMQIAQIAQAGDFFVVTFAGHGSQVVSTTGEEDALDEVWCCFDAPICDNELLSLWGQFRAGVRILVIADCCHSGTSAFFSAMTASHVHDQAVLVQPRMATRMISMSAATAAALKAGVVCTQPLLAPSATILSLSACGDGELAREDGQKGHFTQALLRVWNRGLFAGNYAQFIAAIRQAVTGLQTPELNSTGPQQQEFVLQRPFTI